MRVRINLKGSVYHDKIAEVFKVEEEKYRVVFAEAPDTLNWFYKYECILLDDNNEKKLEKLKGLL